MTRYTSMDALRKNSTGEWTVKDADVVVVEDAPYPTRTIDYGEQARQTGALGGAAAQQALEGMQNDGKKEALARKFEHLWQTWQGPELTKEYRFHPHRKWRFDYYLESGWKSVRVAIELEGGLYSGGRHTRAAGYMADIDKYNSAAMMGITVLRLGTGQVDHQHVTEIIDWLKQWQVQP